MFNIRFFKRSKLVPWWTRLLLMLLFIVGSMFFIRYTRFGNYLNVETLQLLVHSYGTWSVFIYWIIFVVAAIMNIPGTAFLLVAIFIFGYVFGPIYAYFAALSAAWFTFVIGRWMGGKALTKLQHPRLRHYLSQVETRPIRTLIVLRIFLQFSPLVGYTLALTNIQQHKYFVGNVLGLLLPTIVITILTYCFEDFIRLLFL